VKKVIVLIIIIILASLAGYRIYKNIHKKEIEITITKIPVEVSKAEYKEMTWHLELTGNILPKQEVDVYPKVGGEILEKLYVEKGDRIKAGQIIGIINRETITAKLNKAKAALNSAKANLTQIEANLKSIKKDYERIKKLYEQKVVPKQRLDHITAQYEATLAARELAIAQINQAKATLKEIKIIYNNHTITAPISGLVTARYVDEGAMMDRKKPVIRITDDSVVKVNVAINEKDLPYVKIGQKAYIYVDAYPKKVFKGEIKIINPRVDPATRTVNVEIHISNPKHLLKSGMFAHVKLILGKKQVLAIPRDALQKLPGTGVYYVFVIKENKAYLRNVKIGINEGNLVEIKEGLKEGDLVVIKGQNRLREGLPVEIVS